MEYEKLSKVFYKSGDNDFREELDKRKNSYGSYLTPLSVKGFRKGQRLDESYQLFYVNTHELMSLNNKILLNSSKIISLITKLPNFVIEPYFHKLIVNEAQSNNEIEGIRSTKKELKEALSGLMSTESSKKRFKGLMKTYLFINQIKPFTEIVDFRKLYDELVSDEIKEELAPDGKLFRKEYVEVNDGNQTIHIGLSSEEKIIEALHDLIQFLEDEQHPELYRYMIAHYYYEYIHPFYDGNGRTGRLFVCSYLARYLERFSAITFSHAVNMHKSKYYKALEEIPSPLNKGEMTFYLIDMLKLLTIGQEGIIEELELNLSKLERIKAFFNHNMWAERREESYLLQIMTSISVFVDDGAVFPVVKLMEISNNSRYKVNQSMESLAQDGYVHLVNQRPKEYKIADKFLDSILITI